MGRIIVGIDGSDGAVAALRWAHHEAERRGWALTAVLAWSYLDQPGDPDAKRFDPAYTEADARRTLDRTIDRGLAPDAAPAVERHVVCDLPTSALLHASEGADLLVVGARGLGGFKALLLGSVSEQCLHHSRCPVAVVHRGDAAVQPHPAGEPERIVVGVDGSEGAHRALRWALDEARVRQAEVTAVHVWHAPVVGTGPVPVPLDEDELDAAARQVLDDALAGADTSGLTAPVVRTAVTGQASRGVLQAASGADLVVVGTRGRGGFAGLLLGSVSHQVARHAGCPVVVVPSAASR